ncbi:MAG: hypothetical protein ACRDCW_03810 [Sarcina sp.]
MKYFLEKTLCMELSLLEEELSKVSEKIFIEKNKHLELIVKNISVIKEEIKEWI